MQAIESPTDSEGAPATTTERQLSILDAVTGEEPLDSPGFASSSFVWSAPEIVEIPGTKEPNRKTKVTSKQSMLKEEAEVVTAAYQPSLQRWRQRHGYPSDQSSPLNSISDESANDSASEVFVSSELSTTANCIPNGLEDLQPTGSPRNNGPNARSTGAFIKPSCLAEIHPDDYIPLKIEELYE